VIAALTFFAAGALAWLHYATRGALVGMGFTVWTGWFCAVLLACGADCLRSRDRQLLLAWCVMALGWLAALLAWKISANPLVDLTIKNLIMIAALLLVCFRPEMGLSAIAHGLIIFVAYLSSIGVIPSAGQRPKAFLAWSYPDIATGLQHVSLITLGGFGAARAAVLGWRDRRRSLVSPSRNPVFQKAPR
jgi:hypothetical protein